jgi:hypothetical protein
MSYFEIASVMACLVCTVGAGILLVFEKRPDTVSDDRYNRWLTLFVAARVLLTSGLVFLVWALTAPEPPAPAPDLHSAVRIRSN